MKIFSLKKIGSVLILAGIILAIYLINVEVQSYFGRQALAKADLQNITLDEALIETYGLHLVGNERLEWYPELLHQRDPIFLAARYRIELVFELCGEIVVDVLGEMRGQETRHHAPHVCRSKTLVVQHHILA